MHSPRLVTDDETIDEIAGADEAFPCGDLFTSGLRASASAEATEPSGKTIRDFNKGAVGGDDLVQGVISGPNQDRPHEVGLPFSLLDRSTFVESGR